MASAAPRDDGDSRGIRRRCPSGGLDERNDELLYRQRSRKPPPPQPPMPETPSSLSLAAQRKHQRRLPPLPPPPPPPPSTRLEQPRQQQLLPEPPKELLASLAGLAEEDKAKKLLEWELTSLGEKDLRSHAWFHGYQVDRIKAEQLLRLYVAEKHPIAIAGGGEQAAGVAHSNSENDSTSDEDEATSDNSSWPDLSVATSATLSKVMLLHDDHVTIAPRPPKRPSLRRHYYCFLVRLSLNVQQPGRYVVSCLRVDKYDKGGGNSDNNDDDNSNVNDNKITVKGGGGDSSSSSNSNSDGKTVVANNGGVDVDDELKREQRLRRQQLRRQRRQESHPVLHFIINEFISQTGTVYQQPQYTFGHFLPKPATVTSNLSGEECEENKYPPAFNTIPDLVRFYVGGGNKKAVLYFGSGNDGISSSMSSSNIQTEVRIRYPCTRLYPISGEMMHVINSVASSKSIENSRLGHHHSRTRSEVFQVPAVSSSSDRSFTPLHTLLQPSPSSSHCNIPSWLKMSKLEPSNEKPPSSTVSSATANCFKSLSGTKLLNPSLSIIIPNSSSSLQNNFSGPSNSRLLQCSSSTLPLQLSSTHSRVLDPRFLPSTSSNIDEYNPNSPSFVSLLNSDPKPSMSLDSSNQASSSSKTYSSSDKLPINSESALFKPSSSKTIKTSDIPLDTFANTDTFDSFSASGVCGWDQGGKSSNIDMDAEIAAALSAVENDNNDLSKLFHSSDIMEPQTVRSSFAQADVFNGSLYRSRNHQSMIGDRHTNDWYSDNIPEKYMGDLESIVKNDINQFKKRQIDRGINRGFSEVIEIVQKPNNTRINQMMHERHMDIEQELDTETITLKPYSGEDFESWQNRWSDHLRKNFISARDPRRFHSHQSHQMRPREEQRKESHHQRWPEGNQEMVDKDSTNSLLHLDKVLDSKKQSSVLSKTENNTSTIPVKNRIMASQASDNCTVNLDEMVGKWFGLPTNDQQKDALQHVGNQHSIVSNVTHSRQSNKNVTFDGIKTTHLSTVNSNTNNELLCDNNNINFLKSNRKKLMVDQNNSYQHENKQTNNIHITKINYENIVTSNAKGMDYANINVDNSGQIGQNKRLKLINDEDVVKSALKAVHLTVIGDPENSDGATSVAGTGRLAAALCRADGRATVIPYLQPNTDSEKEDESSEPFLDICPLQLLGQPGPEGRRARLDVIERFACLQYLVALTVIVTPCLLLVGGKRKYSANRHLEWHLEDEYEYRRRRFYYRCAGANDDIDSDDDNDELKLNSNFVSCHSLPSKEEWAVEKRHWLDQLAKHRAASLDKWIRTATDVKQAVGDVYGYRALMSALCSDRIQALHDAWASLRQLHTATAVAFESRLRPEFLGHRDKHIAGVFNDATQDLNDDDDNEIDVLLQLPPNITIPDATVLAVLYEQLYDDIDCDNGFTSMSDSKRENKNLRSSSLVTSPLLMLPSPWLSPSSGISGGLGASAAADYGLQILHVLCVQYSEWVQQRGTNDSALSSTKSPMLQLDRFRSNFETLLQQYNSNGDNEYMTHQEKNNISYNEKSEYNRDHEFTYEKYYEDRVEKFENGNEVYDSCVDEDDDDDVTVICCSNNSSATAITSGMATIIPGSTDKSLKTTLKKLTTKENCFRHHHVVRDQDEDRYYRWIKDINADNCVPAPLDTVFHTELHVYLFWPPTLLLLDSNNDNYHQPRVPAYALGTTYAATAAIAHSSENNDHSNLNQAILSDLIHTQLDRAAEDMRLRYKAMDKFLDGACSYSILAAKAAYANNKITND